MDDSLAQDAISSALTSNWKEAIRINHLIVETNPNDVDALNRLGRAYAETNQLARAKKYAHQVLKIDPFNPIAQKSLLRWGRIKFKSTSHLSDNFARPDTFLEEPGKTKIVNLLNLGSSKVVESLNTADEVKIKAYTHRVTVTTLDGKYIGKLPDDLAARLRTLVKGGNKYCAFIKSIDPTNFKIFIRETYRGKDYLNTSSFPSEKIDYVSYAPPELVSSERPFKGSTEDEII